MEEGAGGTDTAVMWKQEALTKVLEYVDRVMCVGMESFMLGTV